MTQRSLVVSVRWLAVAFALATLGLGAFAQVVDPHRESLTPGLAFAATQTATAAIHPASKAHWESSCHERREACALCLLNLRGGLAAIDSGELASPIASPDPAFLPSAEGLRRSELSLAGGRAPPLA